MLFYLQNFPLLTRNSLYLPYLLFLKTMSKRIDNESEHYHSDVEEDVEHDLKRQKLGRSLEDVEDTNIDSALLEAGDDDQQNNGSDDGSYEHARHQQLLNNVASKILETVSKKEGHSGGQVNSHDNLKDTNGHNEDHDVMLHKVVSENAYGDDDTLKRVAESATASMAVRAVNNSRNSTKDEQQDDEQTSHDYNDLINRHGMDTSDDNVQVDLDDASNSHDASIEEMNERRLLAKRGRKITATAGSEAWKQQRKDSHKEVERRRRENINMAINALSGLLPVKESSKAAILSRAAEYIQKLKETENANIEKWTLQKLLSEQNASQLSTANEKLQESLGNAFKEIQFLKNLLKKNNIQYESDDEDMQH